MTSLPDLVACPAASLESSLEKAKSLLFASQTEEGYWWYTLEANETIGAGFIQLMHFLGEVDPEIQAGLVRRIVSEQRADGSWALFSEGPGDLSITIECYFALRLAGRSSAEETLRKAKDFILRNGGLARARVFTRIHLGLFGLVPWSASPSMPVWFILLPPWLGLSIYEFSSWARASVVPLLIVDAVKPVHPLPFTLDELYSEPPRGQQSRGNFFLWLDKVLKLLERLPWHPGKESAIRKAEQWVREHIEKTEDIYPAMAYAAIAMKTLGYPASDPTIRKAVEGLKRFQQRYTPPPLRGGGKGEGDSGVTPTLTLPPQGGGTLYLHQQCCISPNWDTPWAGLALIEAGVDPKDPQLLKAARYLIGKEIRDFRGDWRFKNPSGPAGGWSFEFQNDCFPDIDDTIQILFFLRKVGLPPAETRGPLVRGLAWLLSMQSRNGGWAAFDKDNLSPWVNRIPFSDHGACLDPPTPDITGRMLELLTHFGYTRDHPVIARALSFLEKTEEPFGAWRGRWGVNYIYGTWCVLQGLAAVGEATGPDLQKAVSWLKSIQNKDGGWGESCLSDTKNRYVPLGVSVPSQTAWAVMGLVAAGERDSPSVRRGIEWLIAHQEENGGWEEPYFTGTGFPGHFFIRYHGYRYYFPLLALGRYFKDRPERPERGPAA